MPAVMEPPINKSKAAPPPAPTRKFRLLSGEHCEAFAIFRLNDSDLRRWAMENKDKLDATKINVDKLETAGRREILIAAQTPDGAYPRVERKWFPGDVIETDVDLLSPAYNVPIANGLPTKPPKFALVDSEPVILSENSRVWDSTKETLDQFVSRMRAESEIPDPLPNAANPELQAKLARMNEKDLRAWAAEQEIDLSKAKGKDDVAKICLAAVS